MDSMIKPQILRIIMSSSLYWAWIFLLYWSPLLLGSGQASLYAKGASFLGSAVSLFIWFMIVRAGRRTLSDRLFSRLAPYFLTPLAGLVALVDAAVVTVPLPVLLVAWFLTGLGAAFILVRVSHLLFWEGQESTSFIIFVMLFISCLIALFSSLMPGGIIASITMSVMPLASFLLVSVGRPAPGMPCSPPDVVDVGPDGSLVAHAEGGGRSERAAFGDTISRRTFFVSLMQMFFYSMAFSFALITGLYSSGEGMSSMYVWFGAFLGGFLMMAYSMWLHRYASGDLMQLVLLGITVVGLAPFTLGSILPDEARFASCVLFMFGFTSYDMLGLSRLLSTISAQGISFARYFTLGRFGNALGMFAGWLLAAASFAATNMLQDQIITQALPLALIIGLVVLVMVCSYWRPSSEGETRSDIGMNQRGVWRRSCESLCDDSSLSSREREVFALCAKGRDTAYICSALYISTHTVKSHIYHIYGKMSIHSQQELISLVEKRAEELKAETQS